MTSLTYRSAIGIVIANQWNEVLVGRRIDMENQWQFPQGGINPNEQPQHAVLRELKEETGIQQDSVEILCHTRESLKYDYPQSVVRKLNAMKTWRYVGQEVQFFLLRYLSTDQQIDVHNVPKPEFDAWKWVNFWEPLNFIVEFKRESYRRALTELAPKLELEVNA